MRIYLDNCCFNRPYDDQTQLRVRLEAEAKLKIQEDIRSGKYSLVWSYILDYENGMNPFRERREQIDKWQGYAEIDVVENEKILKIAMDINQQGINKMDSLHIACAISTGANYFLTTDDRVLKKDIVGYDIHITDPIGFIKEVST